MSASHRNYRSHANPRSSSRLSTEVARLPGRITRFTHESVELPGFSYDPIRKRYFKISSEPTSPFVSKTSPDSSTRQESRSLMRLLHLREEGRSDQSFPQMVKKSKLQGLDKHQGMSVANAFHPMQKVSSCHFLTIIDSNGLPSMAGIWSAIDAQGVKEAQWVISMTIANPNSSHPSFEDDQCSLALLPSGSPILLPAGKVTDACGMHSGILVSLVTSRCSSAAFYFPQLNCTDNDRRPSARTLGLGEGTVFSCAFNENTQNVACGMERGGLVRCWFDSTQTCQLFSEHQSIFCLTFQREGQVLLSGTRRGTIYCSDLRQRPSSRYAYKIKLGEWAMCHLHLLENQNDILCSGYDNQLLRIDLRTRRPVLHYVEHVNRYTKTRFTVDESMGIVSCTGQDKTTRLWDLHTGSLLTSFSSPTETHGMDEMSISLFRTSWGKRSSLPILVLAHGDQIFVYQ